MSENGTENIGLFEVYDL